MAKTHVDEAVDTTPEPQPGAPAQKQKRPRWNPLLVRMHFYAGVVVAPFVFLACLTGLIYVFNPQIDRLMEPGILVAEPATGTPLPLNQQVAAAVAAQPNLNLVSVQPNIRPDDTTRVNFYRPGGPEMTNLTVFVNPYTGKVQGSKDVSTMGGAMPFSTWMAQFHGDLGLGEFGRWYSEMASIWLVILTLGGIIVWWQRCATHRKITSGTFWKKLTIVERGRRPGVKRTMSWHSVIGVWTAVLALLFGLTGLPFARATGPKWVGMTGNMHRSSVTLDTKLPGSTASSSGSGTHAPGGASGGQTGMPGGSGSQDMSGMDHDMSGMSGMSGSGSPTGAGRPTGSPTASASQGTSPGGMPSGGGTGGTGSSGGTGHTSGMSGMSGMTTNKGLPTNARADFDAMVKAAAAVGVNQRVRLTGPSRPGVGWTVAENKQSWPLAYDSALIDPATSQVVRTLDWEKATPTVDKINRYIMVFHFGRLFGLVGQILFGLTMLGVMWVTWWGYKMWWQRRPRGTAWRFGKAPTRGSWRKAPRVSLVVWSVITLALFWVFPVLAVSVLGFLTLDAIFGRISEIRRDRAGTAPAAS